MCRTKIHGKLRQGVCFLLIWKLLVVEKMQAKRMEKDQRRHGGKRDRDREPGKDSDSSPKSREVGGERGGVLEADRCGGKMESSWEMSGMGSPASAPWGPDKVYQ